MSSGLFGIELKLHNCSSDEIRDISNSGLVIFAADRLKFAIVLELLVQVRGKEEINRKRYSK